MRRTVWNVLLAASLATMASKALANTCPEGPTGATLEWVEPLAESGTFALGWATESPYAVASWQRPASGGEFEVVRCLPPGRWVPVAEGRVQGAVGSLVRAWATAAQAGEDRLNRLSQSGNLYWRPMVGDAIRPKIVEVAAAPRITPRTTLDWGNLFERLRGSEFSMDLTDAGKARIEEAIERFRGARGRLAVECFSRRYGPREVLIEETQVRATLVARYIVHTFQLPDESVVPMGLGGEQVASGWHDVPRWPRQEIVDGITLRMIPE